MTTGGPTQQQQRVIRQKVVSSTNTMVAQNSPGGGIILANPNKPCYICDEIGGPNSILLSDARTSVTNTELPTKIGGVVGDSYWVIHVGGDIVCKRCVSMFNHLDRLENELDRVKTNIMNLIGSKYGINDNNGEPKTTVTPQPAAKIQRLNTSGAMRKTSNGPTSGGGGADEEQLPRKVTTISTVQTVNRSIGDTSGGSAELTNIFDSPPPEKQTAVAGAGPMAQIRQHTTITQLQQSAAGTAVAASPTTIAPTKKVAGQATKIYKCLACDFKTVDLKQFQPHYETCKSNQCKICKKMFTNVGALKSHMTEKHSNEYVCSICSINYMYEGAFKKHMETNHPDVKTIETTTTAPTGRHHYYKI